MEREEWLRCVELRGCEAIPCRVIISHAVWREFGHSLVEVVHQYPDVDCHVPDDWDELPASQTRDEQFFDAWGCVWGNLQDGIAGQVVKHPLTDWDALSDLHPPCPGEMRHMGPIDWDDERRLIESGRREGILIHGAIDHGFFFQRLYYLRGFNELMVDMATADPRLDRLCRLLLDFNMGLVERYLQIGVDVMHFGDDLGMQDRLTISPQAWRRHVKPAYAALFGRCRQAGAHVYLHSDGYIVDIMPDLLECGATIVNPQDLCNGLDNIKRELCGKVCIDLDIDRQTIVPWGTPPEIDEHIRRSVKSLASPAGGLMLICGIYPGTPLPNIEAVFAAMTHHSRPFD